MQVIFVFELDVNIEALKIVHNHDSKYIEEMVEKYETLFLFHCASGKELFLR